MPDEPRSNSEWLRDQAQIHAGQRRVKELEDERDRRPVSGPPAQSNGPGSQASKIVYQIIVGLFIIMLTAIVGVLYSRQDRFDAIQQARGERVRALELQVDELQRGRSENKARIDYLYQRIFEMPAALPHETPRHR